MTGEHLFS